LGQVVGDGGAVIQGTVEAAAGGAGEVGGTALILTGVGAPAGVAIDVGSTAAIVHGGATGLTGAAHLGKALVTAFSGSGNSTSSATAPKQGETGGPAVAKAQQVKALEVIHSKVRHQRKSRHAEKQRPKFGVCGSRNHPARDDWG
jgi:hypothetical protein